MIQKLRIRFISLAMIALFLLLATIFIGMNTVNYKAVITDVDARLELLSRNKGVFPEFHTDRKKPMPPSMSPETPYESRYFSVLFSPIGEVIQVETSRIKAIDEAAAIEYANQAIAGGDTWGSIGNYRFLISSEDFLCRITFLDCSREFTAFRNFLLISICMALAGYAAFFFVILFFSNRLLRPVAESYEKQKRFITDAGHEIKTPLAIMKANADVLEMEYGESEWLTSIQSQVSRLTDLTDHLVFLSRMEEAEAQLSMIDFPFSDVVCETAYAFHAVAQAKEKHFQCSVQPLLSMHGSEKAIRQLVDILLDNAMKYAPEGSLVSLTVQKQGRYLCLTVHNTTMCPIDRKNLNQIFERFYRIDASRNSQTGGSGIGLSVAKAIVEAHNGKIAAISPEDNSLIIQVQFPI